MLFQATVGEIHRITEYNSFCMESQFWFSQSLAKTSSRDKFKVSHIDVWIVPIFLQLLFIYSFIFKNAMWLGKS